MTIFLGWFAVACFTWVLMTLADAARERQDQRRRALAVELDNRLQRVQAAARFQGFRPTEEEKEAFERFNRASRRLFGDA